MRLFVYEYTCAVEPASHLRAEGCAMLSAIVEDFAFIPDVQVTTLLHPAMSNLPSANCHRTESEETDFRRLAADADFTLVIAPETDGLLTHRCQWVEQSGGKLLGPPSSLVEGLADKWECYRHLQGCRVASPRTMLLNTGRAIPSFLFPAVCKPRLGAGSRYTFIVTDRTQLDACRRRLESECVVQQFVRGIAASVLCLAGPKQRLPLSPGEQHLNGDEQLHYLGGSAPLLGEWSERATTLGQRVLDAIPQCRGFIGVDMILGDAPDGSRDYVIEINPRLTTSYLALRKLADQNLAEVLLRMARGDTVKPAAWSDQCLRYRVGNSEKGVELWPIP